MKDSAIQSSRFGRFVKLARLGASTGASLALSRNGSAAAGAAAEVLGELRGLAAKVGQMASYVDGIVPEAHRDAYFNALKSLQARAVSSPIAAVRARIQSELGAPVEELFASFEETPFASASIGQVHRAVLVDGRVVAVKVQHPDIDRAVASDLDNASMVKSLVGSLAPRALEVDAIWQEIRSRFEAELDYANEASELDAFRLVHADDPHVLIPGVVRERSSRRVLTTDFVDGLSFDEVTTLPEAERARYAETLWRFVFKGLLVHRVFNADPHPGNYVFLPSGRVAFLDFGCTQVIDVENNKAARAMHFAALDRDEEAFEHAVHEYLGTRGGPYEGAVTGLVRAMFTPLFEDEFRFTPRFVSDIVGGMQELKRHALSRKSGFVPMRPSMVFLNRLQFGFYSVLARLDTTVSYSRLEGRILADAGLRAG
ncbi:MAG: AarF/ABC1/UbiB kinase family protein [Polyangiaceae bacterium]